MRWSRRPARPASTAAWASRRRRRSRSAPRPERGSNGCRSRRSPTAAASPRTAPASTLAPGAEMIGWDLTALGLPASDQPFVAGRFTQSIELPGRWLERGTVRGDDPALLDSPLGWAGQRTLATLWFAAGEAIAAARREACSTPPAPPATPIRSAATPAPPRVDPGVIVVRVLRRGSSRRWICWPRSGAPGARSPGSSRPRRRASGGPERPRRARGDATYDPSAPGSGTGLAASLPARPRRRPSTDKNDCDGPDAARTRTSS